MENVSGFSRPQQMTNSFGSVPKVGAADNSDLSNPNEEDERRRVPNRLPNFLDARRGQVRSPLVNNWTV